MTPMSTARMKALRKIPIAEWTDDDLAYYREERDQRRADREERREAAAEREEEAREEERAQEKAERRKERDRERYGHVDAVQVSRPDGTKGRELGSGDRAWMRSVEDAISGRELARSERALRRTSQVVRTAVSVTPPVPGEAALLRLGALAGVPGTRERLAAISDDDMED